MVWHPLEPVDESFFVTADHRYKFPIDLDVPPERVWESIASDESVAAWGLGVQSLRWTSPRPFGVGTTREVKLPLGIMTVRERFFVWDEGKRYAFAAYEANRGFYRRFAENYVIEPRGAGSRLTWTIAIEPQPKLRRLVDLGRPLNRLAFGQFARGARSYFAKNP
jgi:carbon monoxide dehydrogenase subunit G